MKTLVTTAVVFTLAFAAPSFAADVTSGSAPTATSAPATKHKAATHHHVMGKKKHHHKKKEAAPAK